MRIDPKAWNGRLEYSDLHIHVKPGLPALSYFKGCCQESSFERPQYVRGTWGLFMGLQELRTPCRSPSFCCFLGFPGWKERQLLQGADVTRPAPLPPWRRVKHSELWAQEMGRTLEMVVIFLLCLVLFLIPCFKKKKRYYIHHWLCSALFWVILEAAIAGLGGLWFSIRQRELVFFTVFS